MKQSITDVNNRVLVKSWNYCREFARTMSRPFELTYDPYTQRVIVLDKLTSIRRAGVDQTRSWRRP